MCTTNCQIGKTIANFDDIVPIEETDFKIEDAEKILIEIEKVALENDIEFDLKTELESVKRNSKNHALDQNLTMFSFLKPNPTRQVFNVIWSARERMIRDLAQKLELDQKMGEMEPISFEIYGEWEEIEEDDKVLYLWPERYRDGKIHAYCPEENAMYHKRVSGFGRSPANNEKWTLSDKRTTLSFLSKHQPSKDLPIAPDKELVQPSKICGRTGCDD